MQRPLLISLTVSVALSLGGCGGRSGLSDAFERTAPVELPGSGAGGRRAASSGGAHEPNPSGGSRAVGAGGAGLTSANSTGGAASTSAGGSATGGSAAGGTASGGALATTGGSGPDPGPSTGGMGGEAPGESFPEMVSGEMVATELGVYLLASSEREGKVWVYRFALDGELISSWEVSDKVTSIASIVSIGTDIYVSGTAVPPGSTSGIPAAFVKRYDAEGHSGWTKLVDEGFFAPSAPMTTDGSDIFLVSSPIEPTHCDDYVSGGVAFTRCYLEEEAPLPPRLHRFSSTGALLRDVPLDPLASTPYAFEFGPAGRLYLGSYSNAAALPYAEFDLEGALLVDHTQSSEYYYSASLSLLGLGFDDQAAVYVASTYHSPSTQFSDYRLQKVVQGTTPVSNTSSVVPGSGVAWIKDFAVYQACLYFVGGRWDFDTQKFRRFALQTDLNGNVIYESPTTAFSGLFTAVAEGLNEQVYLGGYQTTPDVAAPAVFVRLWPGEGSPP